MRRGGFTNFSTAAGEDDSPGSDIEDGEDISTVASLERRRAVLVALLESKASVRDKSAKNKVPAVTRWR